ASSRGGVTGAPRLSLSSAEGVVTGGGGGGGAASSSGGGVSSRVMARSDGGASGSGSGFGLGLGLGFLGFGLGFSGSGGGGSPGGGGSRALGACTVSAGGAGIRTPGTVGRIRSPVLGAGAQIG